MILKGYCSLHPYVKPLVCILSPISKEYNIKSKETTYSCTKPTEHCPGELSTNDDPNNNILECVDKEIKYEQLFF